MKSGPTKYIESNQIAIVIPTYNESGRIRQVIENTLRYYKHVVVVDDKSTDSTIDEVADLPIQLIRLDKNMGAGFATKTGCEWAFNEIKADIVVTIDGDGQHAPEDIYLVIDKIKEDKLDIVFGYRPNIKSTPWVKRIGSLTLSLLAKLLFNVKLSDTLTGFHAFTNQAYPKIKWESNRYEFVSELVYRVYKSKLKYGEVTVQTIYNQKLEGMQIKDGINSILLMFYWRFFI